jgi:hypothetical protein
MNWLDKLILHKKHVFLIMCNENRTGVVSKLDQAPILLRKYLIYPKNYFIKWREDNDIIWKRLMDLINKKLDKQTWQWIRIK